MEALSTWVDVNLVHTGIAFMAFVTFPFWGVLIGAVLGRIFTGQWLEWPSKVEALEWKEPVNKPAKSLW